MLPNFLGIGVQRAATTWLHHCLSSHPDVFLPAEKELHFFNHQFDRGLDWYESQFDQAENAVVLGEITPNYLHTAPLERLANILPDARLVIILREPVSRAYSAYQLLNEKFSGKSFEEVCSSESGNYLITQSSYAEKLTELYSHFSAEQVLVLMFEDVKSSPADVFHRVCDHLGVREIAPPKEVNQTYNHIVYPRVQETLRRFRLGWSVELVKKTPLAELVKRSSKKKQGSSLKDQDDEQFMVELQNRFLPDIERVETLIDRDLSNWKSGQ